MEFGLAIPTRGPLADRASIEAIATRAEALGFSWLAVPDHLIVPRAIDSRYPYSDTGAFPGSESGECLEQFTLLACDDTRPEQRVDGEHHLLTGGADALVDDIGTLAGIGVRQVLLNFLRAGLERSLASMQRFADEVMAKT